MASFGGIDLGARGAAVFEVASESDDEEFVCSLLDGAVVVIPASSRYIVVRQCPGASFDEVHGNARGPLTGAWTCISVRAVDR